MPNRHLVRDIAEAMKPWDANVSARGRPEHMVVPEQYEAECGVCVIDEILALARGDLPCAAAVSVLGAGHQRIRLAKRLLGVPDPLVA